MDVLKYCCHHSLVISQYSFCQLSLERLWFRTLLNSRILKLKTGIRFKTGEKFWTNMCQTSLKIICVNWGKYKKIKKGESGFTLVWVQQTLRALKRHWFPLKSKLHTRFSWSCKRASPRQNLLTVILSKQIANNIPFPTWFYPIDQRMLALLFRQWPSWSCQGPLQHCPERQQRYHPFSNEKEKARVKRWVNQLMYKVQIVSKWWSFMSNRTHIAKFLVMVSFT